VNHDHILVTGAGGFIGHHLTTFLKREGHWVRGVDVKRPEFAVSDADDFLVGDLRDPVFARTATTGVDSVYALAADMGGMGYISAHYAQILHGNSLINLNTLEASRLNGVGRYLYASSACVYPEFLQTEVDVVALREDDAYPAQPQDAYGWEKLISERLCQHYRGDYGMETRIVRLHSIFGPLGTWDGGREKAPAALCRKVAVAKLTGQSEIELWGDGEQTRSFCYIDDCLEGLTRLMASDHHEPLNQLADMVTVIAGVALTKRYVPGPQGVRGRNSDNTRVRRVLGWEPRIAVEDGLARTYAWVEAQVRQQLKMTVA
jgi:nucleoside-diphosphate-sugar epimerase